MLYWKTERKLNYVRTENRRMFEMGWMEFILLSNTYIHVLYVNMLYVKHFRTSNLEFIYIIIIMYNV